MGMCVPLTALRRNSTVEVRSAFVAERTLTLAPVSIRNLSGSSVDDVEKATLFLVPTACHR